MSAVMPSAAPAIDPPPLRREGAAAVTGAEPDTELSAADRLAHSRAQLRAAMMDISHPPKRAPVLGAGAGNFLDEVLSRLKALPGAATVIESVESWWKQHPLRTVGVMAEEASLALVKPIAQRNPQTLVLGAAVIGALFVLVRPWRWLLRPALFVGLLPQLASYALKRMPVNAWLKMASSMLGQKAAARNSRAMPPKSTVAGATRPGPSL